MPKYDVVVVGAGNAGMSAALQCQLAGKKTLLIEKHNLPGGAATSFRRAALRLSPPCMSCATMVRLIIPVMCAASWTLTA